MKILYIEDEPNLQRLVKRGLERNGHCVTLANNADIAIEILEVAERNFGCFHFGQIFSDYDLALGTSGGDVLDWIKGREPELKTNDHGVLKSPRQVYLERFTFLSGNTVTVTLHNRTIAKPCGISALLRALKTPGPLHIDDWAGDD